MKNIKIYDVDYEVIADICEANDVNTWDIVEVFLDIIKGEKIDLTEWL